MDWAVYTPDFLYELENVFLGQSEKTNQPEVWKSSHCSVSVDYEQSLSLNTVVLVRHDYIKKLKMCFH